MVRQRWKIRRITRSKTSLLSGSKVVVFCDCGRRRWLRIVFFEFRGLQINVILFYTYLFGKKNDWLHMDVIKKSFSLLLFGLVGTLL